MGIVTVYCAVSGCTPVISSGFGWLLDVEEYGPVVTEALESLRDIHERTSQDDLCVVGPIHPSGQPYVNGLQDGVELNTSVEINVSDLDHEKDIRVVPHCVMEESFEAGSVAAPPPNPQHWDYLVSYDSTVMLQTYALDILALATHGRVTPLRVWRLAMQQNDEEGFREYALSGVDYGELVENLQEQTPVTFPGFSEDDFEWLEEIEDIEVVKEKLINEGLFWVWMAPDRFPVSPTEHDDPAPILPDPSASGALSVIETLPNEVLLHIVSPLPLASLLNFASTSRTVRMLILGNDYLACTWLYYSAPWWIPVPTHTARKAEAEQSQPSSSSGTIRTYLAARWPEQTLTMWSFPTGLDWGYVGRCSRSGSMRNRQRIWKTVLDIERVADRAGV